MTVKELKEILEGCNDDARVIVQHGYGPPEDFNDVQVWVPANAETVTIDLTYGEER